VKILFFIYSLGAGGKERRLLELAHYLKANTKYRLFLVLMNDNIHYDIEADLFEKIIIKKRNGRKKDIIMFFKFNRICKDIRPDIIHAWGSMETFYAIPSKWINKMPLVTSMIADAIPEKSGWAFSKIIFKLNVLFADCVLANSYAGLEAYHISSPKARVIYNGLRLGRFSCSYDSTEIKKKWGIDVPFVVVMVAGFSQFKCNDLFIDLARRVSLIRKDIKFVAVGDGDKLDHIRKRLVNENIDNVLVTGAVKEVEQLISIANIGVLFTHFEGISNAVMEYMALKKPVIVTGYGGTKELVRHGESGYILSNDDLHEIEKKLLYLIDNQRIADDFGKKGFGIIEERFSINKMGSEFIDVYKSLTH
jgi:glycosyltransferase involved in cell wall biosynthesis